MGVGLDMFNNQCIIPTILSDGAKSHRRHYKMSKIIFGVALAAILCEGTKAEVIVANNPVMDTVGFYSDAYDSKGAYTYAQSGAQGFELEESHITSSVKWWGSMNGFNGQGISNIDCFQIVIWDNTFNAQLTSQTIGIENITIVTTGDTNFFGQPVYEFYVPFSVSITSGNYYMNIGAQLNDAAGDQFVWSQGQHVNNFWYTDINGAFKWGDWRPLPNFIGNTAGGAFVLNAPTPGAIALLGMAGIASNRRRR